MLLDKLSQFPLLQSLSAEHIDFLVEWCVQVHLGSANAVGLSTLAGFLAAISFKLLE